MYRSVNQYIPLFNKLRKPSPALLLTDTTQKGIVLWYAKPVKGLLVSTTLVLIKFASIVS